MSKVRAIQIFSLLVILLALLVAIAFSPSIVELFRL